MRTLEAERVAQRVLIVFAEVLMRHSLRSKAGERGTSFEQDSDTVFVLTVSAPIADRSVFSDHGSPVRRVNASSALLVGVALAALLGILASGFRHSSSDMPTRHVDSLRNSFQAAEPFARQAVAPQRIQACVAGEGSVCNALGVEIHQREGFTGPNAEAARVSFDRACQSGHAVGCNNLGVVYEHASRQDSGVNLDVRAVEMFRRACDLGSSDGCGNLGAMYDNGWGTAQNFSRAFELYTRACEAGNALGCSNLGALYFNGRGVNRDLGRAGALFDRACTGNSSVGCNNLAVIADKE